ncbi:MAG: hypothetical protein WCK28_09170, partial [Burkholderiales bacterium]
MTAATFDGTLEGAPRASVEDAWRTLNTRYATGTAVLVAALALLWLLGMGPRSAPVEAPTAMSSTTLGPATEPAARATASPGGAVTASGAIPNGAARTAERWLASFFSRAATASEAARRSRSSSSRRRAASALAASSAAAAASAAAACLAAAASASAAPA